MTTSLARFDDGFGKVVTGHVYTPYMPDTATRVMLLVDDADMARLDNLSRFGTTTVTDLLMDEVHVIRRAECGAGCRCAAEIVR